MNTRFFEVDGKSKTSSAENPLLMKVFEFRETHNYIKKEEIKCQTKEIKK